MDENQISDVGSLFSAFGRTLDLAEAMGQPLWRVEKWRSRGRIPPEYWADICKAFANKRQRGRRISAELLMQLHANRAKRRAS